MPLITRTTLGHLPKREPYTARAWMHLKLLLALMIERLIYDAEFVSPRGYDVRPDQPVARFKEISDSVITSPRCPLPLRVILGRGKEMRKYFQVNRRSRPLPIEEIEEFLLS